MTYFRLVEDRIREAAENGAFADLPGAGKPIDLDQSDNLAGDNALGYRMLRKANMLPAWLDLAKDIERRWQELDRLDARHETLVAHFARTGDWERGAPLIAAARNAYETAARALRREQDRFNMDAPGIALERPGIWVEYHLERLDRRVAAVREPVTAGETSA